MAGQLYLDPLTMTLCDGGITAELEQALLNSEAVANCISCSISFCAISFIVYCSLQFVSLYRTEVEVKWKGFLEQLKEHYSAKGGVSSMCECDPLLLFVLVLELPKRALIEVRPTLLIMEDDDTDSESDVCIQDQAHATPLCYWGFQEESSHNYILAFKNALYMKTICRKPDLLTYTIAIVRHQTSIPKCVSKRLMEDMLARSREEEVK